MAIRLFFRIAKNLSIMSPQNDASDSLFTKYLKITAVVALYWYIELQNDSFVSFF